MNIQDLNEAIKETSKLGEILVFNKFDDSEFERYCSQVNQVVVNALKVKKDTIQIKTCEIILKTNIESFKLNLLERIFSPYYITGTILWPKNTSKEIRKRYILNINGRLPILINEINNKC